MAHLLPAPPAAEGGIRALILLISTLLSPVPAWTSLFAFDFFDERFLDRGLAVVVGFPAGCLEDELEVEGTEDSLDSAHRLTTHRLTIYWHVHNIVTSPSIPIRIDTCSE